MNQRKYGLFTAITMIVGIVIGSGIFFKADDVLKATNGNVILGVIVFCIAAIGIIFGGLSIGELASRNDQSGGVIAYAEQNWNKGLACCFGWFQTFLYYPTLIAVVGWISGVYLFQLFGYDASFEMQLLAGGIAIIFLYLVNIFSAKLGGIFQGASTIIKLIPLIFIAITGLIWGDPVSLITESAENIKQTGWLMALVPVAFAFDGWVVSTSISHEIKDSKKNLKKALIIAPIIILVVYVAYFVGISGIVGTDVIIAEGNAHVEIAANNLLGNWGGKAILVFIIISVLGTLNGLILGSIRLPYSLSVKNLFPGKNTVGKVNKKLGLSLYSGIIAFVTSIVWVGLHWLTQSSEVFQKTGADVSEISIVMNYILFIILYVAVIKLAVKKQINGIFKGFICPILATIGSLIVVWAGMQHSLFWYFAIVCALILGTAIIYYILSNKKNNDKINVNQDNVNQDNEVISVEED